MMYLKKNKKKPLIREIEVTTFIDIYIWIWECDKFNVGEKNILYGGNLRIINMSWEQDQFFWDDIVYNKGEISYTIREIDKSFCI